MVERFNLKKGRKVHISVYGLMKYSSFKKFKTKKIKNMNIRTFHPLTGSYFIPYRYFSERDIAKWLYFKFGAGEYKVQGWKPRIIKVGKRIIRKKGVVLYPLIRIRVVNSHTFYSIDKKNISRFKAWRDKLEVTR